MRLRDLALASAAALAASGMAIGTASAGSYNISSVNVDPTGNYTVNLMGRSPGAAR